MLITQLIHSGGRTVIIPRRMGKPLSAPVRNAYSLLQIFCRSKTSNDSDQCASYKTSENGQRCNQGNRFNRGDADVSKT